MSISKGGRIYVVVDGSATPHGLAYLLTLSRKGTRGHRKDAIKGHCWIETETAPARIITTEGAVS